MRRAMVVGAFVALGLGWSSAHGQVVKEPGSGLNFDVHRQVMGKPHTLVGVGLRKVFVFAKVYAAGLYVDDETGKPAFAKLLESSGGNLDALRGTAKLNNWLIGGDFGKCMEWVFVRDLEKGKMAKTVKESLERELGDLGAPDLKDAADKFLGALDVPLKKWQRLVLVQRPGAEMNAILDGKLVVKVRNRKIAQAMWRIYVGPNPVQADLKKSLLAKIENLQ